ncbi:hypothetical protein TL16_g09026 [Triparma laevis f. inornata]|uniref:Ribosomal protein S18 n=2 Tax=Triparma laevis TaxID=1534972 RepID=A0A9W7CJU8_9STRA|nr:hypothetical protein TL16_g09026 [Triparma laevis f. inornata]GMI05954.1 hypothetical protein TrLO_g5633 [Triparma laevis f. longispina]
MLSSIARSLLPHKAAKLLRPFASKSSKLLPPDIKDLASSATPPATTPPDFLTEKPSSPLPNHYSTQTPQFSAQKYTKTLSSLPPNFDDGLIDPTFFSGDDPHHRLNNTFHSDVSTIQNEIESYYALPKFDHLNDEDKLRYYEADLRRLNDLVLDGLVFDPIKTEDVAADGLEIEDLGLGDKRIKKKEPKQVFNDGGRSIGETAVFDRDLDDGKGTTARFEYSFDEAGVELEDYMPGKVLSERGDKYIYRDSPPAQVMEKPRFRNRKEARTLDQNEFRYTNLKFLRQFVSESGAILGRRITGISAKDQRKISKLIKRARSVGLIPTTGGWSVEENRLSLLGGGIRVGTERKEEGKELRVE